MGKNIFIRDIPLDLYNDIKKIKKGLGCKTWVTFLYEVDRRLKHHARTQP